MKIHPIVMYPFHHPNTSEDLNALINWMGGLSRYKRYTKPVTVVNRQTFYRKKERDSFQLAYDGFRQVSRIIDSWCVDTCQMWLTGFGNVFDAVDTNIEDIFWIIPGDFDYASHAGQKMLERFHDIPQKVYDHKVELCIGEIRTSQDDSKQLIDTYSTYALLYNWFPNEAKQLREIGIRKPRSEFFALSGKFLELAMIESRWYAYEQTVVLLLLAMATQRKVSPVKLSDIRDYAGDRDNPASALQQAERTERVLKHYWRECRIRQNRPWQKDFEELSTRSNQIMATAKVILNEALPPQ